jgi:hypothetical protein
VCVVCGVCGGAWKERVAAGHERRTTVGIALR